MHGYKETVVAPKIECTISHDNNTSLINLSKLADVPITFETDSGKTYIIGEAWITESPELNSQEGSVALTFEGMSVEES